MDGETRACERNKEQEEFLIKRKENEASRLYKQSGHIFNEEFFKDPEKIYVLLI